MSRIFRRLLYYYYCIIIILCVLEKSGTDKNIGNIDINFIT